MALTVASDTGSDVPNAQTRAPDRHPASRPADPDGRSHLAGARGVRSCGAWNRRSPRERPARGRGNRSSNRNACSVALPANARTCKLRYRRGNPPRPVCDDHAWRCPARRRAGGRSRDDPDDCRFVAMEGVGSVSSRAANGTIGRQGGVRQGPVRISLRRAGSQRPF